MVDIYSPFPLKRAKIKLKNKVSKQEISSCFPCPIAEDREDFHTAVLEAYHLSQFYLSVLLPFSSLFAKKKKKKKSTALQKEMTCFDGLAVPSFEFIYNYLN